MKSKNIFVSIVIPCLNEQETLGACIKKTQCTLETIGIQGEVIIADNGSTDNSAAIAKRFGASVVHQPLRGYGAAYLAGFAAARGQYLLMGDSDDTYDFTDLERFITPLHEGYDLVIGNRFKGKMHKDAMSWARRYIGNPILSGLLRLLFRTDIGDSHCGMRSFTADAYKRMALQTTGMEFASEMVVKAVQAELKILEIPINYAPRAGESKLHPLPDAWRHIRYLLKQRITRKPKI
jgi:glycosyltransferase involved in cell wall biosynthesis